MRIESVAQLLVICPDLTVKERDFAPHVMDHLRLIRDDAEYNDPFSPDEKKQIAHPSFPDEETAELVLYNCAATIEELKEFYIEDTQSVLHRMFILGHGKQYK